MKPSLLPLLCCPQCRCALSLVEAEQRAGEIISGRLQCAGCSLAYPVVRAIPRFVSSENYADSFGFQWQRFQRTQLDSHSGTTISRDRFLRQTGWPPESLDGALVLDAGCGAGRFAEVALSLGAHTFAIDYSEAVDACLRNFDGHPNLHVLQADIYNLPFRESIFDCVYSFGVLQHTPDPHAAFLSLPRFLKPGGRIAIDVYLRGWSTRLHPKSLIRPITSRLPQQMLFHIVERSVPYLLSVSRALGRVPKVGRLLKRLVPVADYYGVQPLSEHQLREWAVLDTFDWLSPTYDKPQTARALQSWLNEAGLTERRVLKVAALVGRGIKPAGVAAEGPIIREVMGREV